MNKEERIRELEYWYSFDTCLGGMKGDKQIAKELLNYTFDKLRIRDLEND